MTDFLKDSLHTVSQWLLIPTMAILLLPDSRHRGLHRRDYRGGGEGTFRRQRKRDKSNLEYPREESV